jgi:hypothetical protein
MFPAALAVACGAVEVIVFLLVDEDLDIPSDEEMLAFFAETQFVQRPPLLEGIVSLHDFEPSPGRRVKGGEWSVRLHQPSGSLWLSPTPHWS